jgi:hypothetical protein
MLFAVPPFDTAPPIMDALIKRMPKEKRVVVAAIQPKMGTTWTGHILHQLVNHAGPIDASRNLILDSPYPEFSQILFNQTLDEMNDPPYWEREPFASFPDGPVTIRTHAPLAELHKLGIHEDKGFKLLCVMRNPKDTILSMWRFMPTVVGIPYEKVPVSGMFLLMRALGMMDKLFADYADFWERRHHENVLVLFFDDLKQDLEGSVRRLAAFLDLRPALTEEQLQTVISQSTQKFMTSPEVLGRFNDVPPEIERAMMEKNGLQPEDVDVRFKDVGVVRKGGGKSGQELGEADVQRIQGLWERFVQARTGFATLEEMQQAFAKEREAKR